MLKTTARGFAIRSAALVVVALGCGENDESKSNGATGGSSGGGTTASGGASGTATGGSSGASSGVGGNAGSGGGCMTMPTGACSAPEVRVTDVSFGVNLIGSGNEGDTQPIPLAIAAKPNGGSRVAAMGADGRVYVGELDCNDAL